MIPVIIICRCMVLEAYGYKQQIIKSLKNINDESENFYTYKNLSFLSKLKPDNRKLVIIFHGAVPGEGIDRIIFRGYNWKFKNTDVVCISDYLLNIYH